VENFFYVVVHFIAQKFLFEFFVLLHVAIKRHPTPNALLLAGKKNVEKARK
jgi:hypothetical protein